MKISLVFVCVAAIAFSGCGPKALKHTENALTQRGNKVDAILTAYDGLAGGAAQALAEQKLSGKVPITGQDAELDACKRVIEGTQAMTLYKPVKLLGAAAAEAAMALAGGQAVPAATRTVNNGKIEVRSLLLEPIAVDKTNMNDKIIADGYQTKEAVYGK